MNANFDKNAANEQKMPDPNEEVSRLLEFVAGRYEEAILNRIRSIYLEGSYADGEQVSNSDLDLVIILKNGRLEETRARMDQLTAGLAGVSPVELDVSLVDESSFASRGLTPMLKFGAKLISGQEIRPQYDLIAIEEWARERMHAAYWLMTKVFDRQLPVSLPRGYPDPGDPFFGYTNRTVRLTDGSQVPSTRNLIRVTGWAATALLASQVGQYVSTKRDCARLYRQYMPDRFAPLHERIHDLCRAQWNCLVPAGKEEKGMMRELCRQTLAFENYFLSVYKRFVLQELRSGEPEQVGQALWVMRQVPYDVPEINAVLAEIGTEVKPVHP